MFCLNRGKDHMKKQYIIFFILFLLIIAPVYVDACGKDDISEKLDELAALHNTVISDYNDQNFTKHGEAELRILFVKCSNVTMNTDGKDRIFKFSRGSDTDRVIDHGIIRFKQTIEDMTDHSVTISPYCIWLNEPMTLPADGFGYEDVQRATSVHIPTESFDSVFFFSGRQVAFGTTSGNILISDFGESCVFPLDTDREINNIDAHLSVEEERKDPWTCGYITHEFIHQIDIPSRLITGDERFPTCHQYQVDGKAALEYLIQTREGNDIFLTNPENGLKWKYVPGKYPDFIGDYYEAFFRGEIIDTKDGNRKKGMFPSLWQFLCSSVKLGTYTIKNTSTNSYLFASDRNDRAGASSLLTVKNPDLSSKNVKWEIVYDLEAEKKGGFKLIPKLDDTELMRAEISPVYDTAALYRIEWGCEPTENKCFTFELSKNKDGSYRITTALKGLSGFALCDTGGGVKFDRTDKNNSWKITEVKS